LRFHPSVAGYVRIDADRGVVVSGDFVTLDCPICGRPLRGAQLKARPGAADTFLRTYSRPRGCHRRWQVTLLAVRRRSRGSLAARMVMWTVVDKAVTHEKRVCQNTLTGERQELTEKELAMLYAQSFVNHLNKPETSR
jgi:hypothetical protein